MLCLRVCIIPCSFVSALRGRDPLLAAARSFARCDKKSGTSMQEAELRDATAIS